jgi:hypothetical protein
MINIFTPLKSLAQIFNFPAANAACSEAKYKKKVAAYKAAT